MDGESTHSSVFGFLFNDHPASVGETYAEHRKKATGFALQLLAAGLTCMVHALLPCAFPRRASDTVQSLHEQLASRRARSVADPSAPTGPCGPQGEGRQPAEGSDPRWTTPAHRAG